MSVAQVNEEEAKELFSLFDRDGNGQIDAAELGILIRSLGESPTEAQILEMIEKVDDNKNGVLEFDEFMHFMRTQTFTKITK